MKRGQSEGHTMRQWGGRIFAWAGLLALAGGAAWADITLELAVKEGEKVSDIARIVARAQSDQNIDKVEFLVDDQLKFTDTSTPYEFDWDTIQEKEGEHTLTVIAYDSDMRSKRSKLSLVIDNELGLGANALAKQAMDAWLAKERENALKYSRRALKAEAGNVEACRVLAKIRAASGDPKDVLPKAIAVLEKANGLDTHPAALLELAGYKIQHALLPESANAFFGELQEVTELRKKAANLHVDAVTQKNAGNRTTPDAIQAIGDALMDAGRFHEAAAEYGKVAIADTASLPLINRYALALALDNRAKEAVNRLSPLLREKKGDAASRAVFGLAQLHLKEWTLARKAVEPDLTDHHPAALIVAAYADAVLGNRAEALKQAKDAVALLPNMGETQFAFAAVAPNLVEADKALNKALALSPFQVGPYLDYACRVAVSTRADRNDQALNMSDLVLKLEPGNLFAKQIQIATYLQAKRMAEAEPMLLEVTKKDPKAADMQMLMAVYWGVKDNGARIAYYMEEARKADPKLFALTAVPTPGEYLIHLNRRTHYRRAFFLTPATLYPENR